MPFGDFVNQIPAPVFLAIHLTVLLNRRGLRLALVRSRGEHPRLGVQGRYADDIAEYDRVHAEILQMADMLSDGIIAQFPAKFTH